MYATTLRARVKAQLIRNKRTVLVEGPSKLLQKTEVKGFSCKDGTVSLHGKVVQTKCALAAAAGEAPSVGI